MRSKRRVFKSNSGPDVLIVEAEDTSDTASSSASNEAPLVDCRRGENKPNSAAAGGLSGGHNHLRQPSPGITEDYLAGLISVEAEASDIDVRRAARYTAELLWDLPSVGFTEVNKWAKRQAERARYLQTIKPAEAQQP